MEKNRNRLYYICKYTPVELLESLGADPVCLDEDSDSFEEAEQIAHPNLCGFGKSIAEAVLQGKVKELVLVNCCDTIRGIYDLLACQGNLDFLYLMDMPRCADACSRERMRQELVQLAEAYASYRRTGFDSGKFCTSFQNPEEKKENFIGILGARLSDSLFEMTKKAMPLPVRNLTCVNGRQLYGKPEGKDFGELMEWYAGALLEQMPCMRMEDPAKRRELFANPFLKGVIYHTLKFCDFYSFEYAGIRKSCPVPILKIESDYTRQSSGQLLTRIEAFRESLISQGISPEEMLRKKKSGENDPWEKKNEEGGPFKGSFEKRLQKKSPGEKEAWKEKTGEKSFRGSFAEAGPQKSGLDKEGLLREKFAEEEPWKSSGEEKAEKKNEKTEEKERSMGKGYAAGIDSGSTSTDVVILDRERHVIAETILPTGAGAAKGAERALEEALQKAGLGREDLSYVVTTGYGRNAISLGDETITEITCHARGAHFLDPSVRTVIDIGGQDSKVIRLDEKGKVENFVMNDKCAAGTGRFLEMMAHTLETDLDTMSKKGIHYADDITISSMCTVFAESEVVSLIAENRAIDDIVHGLNKAVAQKTAALVKRVGGKEAYMMTGGVSRNEGLVKTLEETLHTKLLISDQAQLCGALGAALFALDESSSQNF